jgi:hydrogenase-4 component E
VRALVDPTLVFVALVNLTLLGSSRLAACVRLTAIQGMALGVLPVLVATDGISIRLVLIGVVIFVLKGIIFPQLLLRAIRSTDVRHEVEPIVGYAASILLGILALGLSFWVASRLVLPRPVASPLVLPLALATILIGLYLIVSRRKAIMQVVGYLVLENGVFIFGVALAREEPFLVEMGVLLDVFVAVFVMGIMVFHISREFDHIDVDQLTSLKD